MWCVHNSSFVSSIFLFFCKIKNIWHLLVSLVPSAIPPRHVQNNLQKPFLFPASKQLLCDASSMLQPHQCVLYEGGLSKDYWGFSSHSCLMPSTQAEALLIQRDVNSCGIEIMAQFRDRCKCRLVILFKVHADKSTMRIRIVIRHRQKSQAICKQQYEGKI